MDKDKNIPTTSEKTHFKNQGKHRENGKPKKKAIKSEYYEMKPTLTRKYNLRFIEPYEFKYQLYTKGRWIGKKILDVLVNEFRQYDSEYFVRTLKDGKFRVNGEIVEPDYILKRDDFMTHLVIRKENPIIDQKLNIVFEDDDYLVVDKPSSWPVHVCGGYQFNTLHRIMMDEYGYSELKVLHRLDKHTSGIVITAKNKDAAEKFRRNLHSDKVSKTYLCRVKGDFQPETANVVRHIIFVNKSKGIYTDCDYYTTDYDENVDTKYDKSGCKIDPEDSDDEGKHKFFISEKNVPKYAETNFEKLFYDKASNTSIVIAKPITGRTHQIRIHLRYLGFPIANDPCYGGVIFNDLEAFDNPDMIKHQFVQEQDRNFEVKTDEDKSSLNSLSGISHNNIVSEIYCYKIWLHAWQYKFDKYNFKTEYPEWANKDYKICHKF